MSLAAGRSMMTAIGPTLPTLALQQVVRYLRYTGRAPAAMTPRAEPLPDPDMIREHNGRRLG